MSRYNISLKGAKGDEAIAKLQDGSKNGKILYLTEAKTDSEGLDMDLVDLFTQFCKEKRLKMPYQDMEDMCGLLAENLRPTTSHLKDIYKSFMAYAQAKNYMRFRGCTLLPVPTQRPHQVDNILVGGSNGKGKSKWASEYMKAFVKIYPDSHIFLFSAKPKEKEFWYKDLLDHITQIDLSLESLIDIADSKDEDGTTVAPYRHFIVDGGKSLVVFDDVEGLAPKIEKALTIIASSIYKTGRSSSIFSLTIRHRVNDGLKTKDLMIESNKVVLFHTFSGLPRTNVERVLEEYKGFTRTQLEQFYNTKSPWIQISCSHPPYVLTQNECYLLDR